MEKIKMFSANNQDQKTSTSMFFAFEKYSTILLTKYTTGFAVSN